MDRIATRERCEGGKKMTRTVFLGRRGQHCPRPLFFLTFGWETWHELAVFRANWRRVSRHRNRKRLPENDDASTPERCRLIARANLGPQRFAAGSITHPNDRTATLRPPG